MKGKELDAAALKAIEERRKKLKQPELSRTDVVKLQDTGKILIIVQNMVFDVTNYITHHPGGEHIMKSNSGKDATDKFMRIHTHAAHSLLPGMYIGDYVEPDDGKAIAASNGRLAHAVQTSDTAQVTVASHLTFGSANQREKEKGIEKSAMFNTIDLADIRATMTVGDEESSDMVARPHLDLSFAQRGVLQEIPEEDETVSVTPMQNSSKLDAFYPSQDDCAEEEAAGSEHSNGQKLEAVPEQQGTCEVRSNGNIAQDLFPRKSLEHKQCPFSGQAKVSGAQGNAGNCPFLALTMMNTEAESAPVPKLVSQGSNDSLNSFQRKSGSFSSSKGKILNSSSFLNYAGAQPADAVESPRSMRSRDDVTVSSRNASTSFQGQSSHFGSKSTLQGTNLRQAGGVFRASRVRRKHVHVKKNKAPKVDLQEWKFHSNFIVSSWRKLLRKVSYADLGLSIYESVRDVDELEPLFRFTNRVVQGTKFVDMLSSIVDNIHSPAEIYVKIADLAPLHHRKGVRGSQMPLMQEIVMRVFDSTLGDDMLEEEKKAWLWMWAFLTKALDQSLKEVGSTLSVVRDCWESILEQYTPADLGELIYDQLFKLAPNVASLFTKPREVMAIKMGNTLGTLVSFADDPESMKQQVTWLGVRHVLYNVRPHHIPLIGPVFMNVLSEAAGAMWTPEVEKSWGIVIKMVCENMAEAIQNGEDYGTSLEHIVLYLREHVDIEVFSKNFQAELAITCPSIFENMHEELRSESASSFSRTISKVVNSIGSDQASGISPSTSAVSQNGVSHLIRMSAFKGGNFKHDDDSFSHSSSAPAHTMRQKRTNSKISMQSKEPGSEEVELLIRDVYDFVAEACELVWEPEKQVEKVYIYAPRFYKRGIRSENLKGLGYSFEVALKNTVGEENWGEHMSDSIRWLWQTLVESLTNELNGLKTSRGELILEHWQEVRVNTDIEDLGSIFWKHLNDESPEQTHLFRRSFTMWGKLLQHIMEMLLLSLAEPETFFEQLFELTIRHIRYGVRPEYLAPFGTALLLTLEEVEDGREEGRRDEEEGGGRGKMEESGERVEL
ncbi:hypothetical protein GUITHDRAFT_120658 [Guillardia theta CCMP2712]|uniref:Globin family profile domain-containing protein n=2 Tax=Guillardia theta TaxID=55529 RepID=L1IAP2_GUITC|nr:hypothetical protein GUITHDRAFT_120658 [Guillardia theta CCMP2712]EKX33177.1 hypothetical protein GUITHDRAFT_120658 [Guillardia theta CCMP2712]|eukprot:XP_005820157.1 hypothetical protein GUITHDRAFT_120658 [Guillardia theta CCMP2712]